MASELSYLYTGKTGANVYAVIYYPSQQVWNGTTAENLTVANWGNYDVAMPETPSGSYFYVADFPTGITQAHTYVYRVFERIGGSPAITDPCIGQGTVAWDGSAEIATETDVSTLVSRLTSTRATYLDNLPGILAHTNLINSGTQIAVNSAVVSGDTLGIYRGDMATLAITGLGPIPDSRSKLWFTVKKHYNDTDPAAIVQVTELDGLVILNGAEADIPADASFTVDDETAGDVTIVLKAATTAVMPVFTNCVYDIQYLDGAVVKTLAAGTFTITADVTRAVS